ncbi:hypothetical protein TorRG33x02_031120 [Trema orientale]|uniref:Uncharacterized protein n=1 Tax=Trema orientale TaxID=63057 RepID=A0A2P5FT32_TREOI|nr:hypothetical protein TorRG33x02_031120 [Trema orientale]
MSSAGSVPPTGSIGSNGSGGDRLDPKGKRIRDESRGITIEKELRKQKVAKLVVDVDENSRKLIQKNGKIFNNLFAHYLRDRVLPTTLS